MATVQMNVRIDETLKTQVNEVCSIIGISANEAIKMFLRQTFMPNSPYFDPTEEIGGAIMEYLKNRSEINKSIINKPAAV